MYKQMNIFDFIEKIPESVEPSPSLTLFEKVFEKINDPVLRCVNCLCQYCVNNAEEVWRTVRPEELQEPCFNCDECFEYGGEPGSKICDRKDCEKFVLSDYGAGKNRKKIRLIKI